MNRDAVAAIRRSAGFVAGFIVLKASALQPVPIRFIDDQTIGMPVLQMSVHAGAVRITGGLLDELEAAIARQLNLRAVHLAIPRKRVGPFLESGQGDVLCYYDPVWLEHADHFDWTGPIITNQNLLVARRGIPIPKQLSDLQQGRIGMVRGYVYPELQGVVARPGITRDDAPDDESNFRKLVGGRTDYLITHQLLLDYMLRVDPDLASKLGDRLVIRRYETRCAVRRNAPVTAEQIDAALAALKLSGEYDGILAKYR